HLSPSSAYCRYPVHEGWGWFELATIDPAHEVGDGRVGRRGHSEARGPRGDHAVRVVDLRAPAALDVAADRGSRRRGQRRHVIREALVDLPPPLAVACRSGDPRVRRNPQYASELEALGAPY